MFTQMRTELRDCRRYCDLKMPRSIFDKYIFATIDRVFYDEILFGSWPVQLITLSDQGF